MGGSTANLGAWSWLDKRAMDGEWAGNLHSQTDMHSTTTRPCNENAGDRTDWVGCWVGGVRVDGWMLFGMLPDSAAKLGTISVLGVREGRGQLDGLQLIGE